LSGAGRAIGEAVSGCGRGSFVCLGSMFKYFFRERPPANYTEVKECDTARFGEFWRGMLSRGIFIPPSQFETNFLSVVHGSTEIGQIAAGYRACLS
ncbi:MAG: aspartate aminotransferase family protein, partial [Methanoregulaceae archaeon]|nr:aspartate aminotransferase family protein [Methanoregulaceae archaeon]